jgi:hypothetical protein
MVYDAIRIASEWLNGQASEKLSEANKSIVRPSSFLQQGIDGQAPTNNPPRCDVG